MTLSTEAQQIINRWREQGVLLRHHENILEIWEQDGNLEYPFFRDSTLDSQIQLHEHERFGNLNYAAQMKIWSAHKHLELIVSKYEPRGQLASYFVSPLPRKLHIGEDLEVSAFFADLISALDAVTGQVILVYGFPIKLRWASWRKLADLLSRMSAPWNTVTQDGQDYNVMSSGNLVNIVLEGGSFPGWMETCLNYRNNYTHRTFFATIIDTEGFYLPRDASILPSLVLNPIETARTTGTSDDVTRIKSELFNQLPLHEYCEATYGRVRDLIELVYEQIVNTYSVRLCNPNTIQNPHQLYRIGLSLS